VDLLAAVLPIITPVVDLVAALTPLITLSAVLIGLLTRFASQFLIAPVVGFLTDSIAGLAGGIAALVDLLRDTDWSIIWGNITSAFSTGVTAVAGFFHGIGSAVADAWTRIREFINNLGAAIGGLGADLFRDFVDLGRDIVGGIVAGIRNAAGRIGAELRNAAAAALSGVQNFLGIGSPSKVMADQVGRWLPAGVEQGIQEGTPGLLTTIAAMVGDIAAITGRGAPSSSLTVDVGGVVVNGSATVADAAVVGDTVGRSVASAARRAQVALAVRMR
jgi:phage-related protein